VPQGTKQWEPEAAKVKQSGADAVYYSGYYADGGPFAKALRNAGYKGIFMSDDGVKDPNFVKLAGTSAANGAYLTCPCADASKNQDFATAYKTAFNQDAGTYSAEAYDVANAIVSILKGLGSNITRQAVSQAAANVNYQGLTKTIGFGSNHELKTAQAYLYKVNNGTIDYIGPIS
jgi:branched-chain amino acid transport system substrate-binding protein